MYFNKKKKSKEFRKRESWLGEQAKNAINETKTNVQSIFKLFEIDEPDIYVERDFQFPLLTAFALSADQRM